MLFWLILLLVLLNVLAAKPYAECGYKQCPPTRDGSLNVHLIAHSHMDAGWVKTFDEYYHGTNANISSANVQLIYHSVLSELMHDRKRRFTFSETAYFWRWWKVQSYATRATFRNLVAEGRIHFAGGGWVETDEATVDYLQILDQYTWGLRKLNDTLGPCGKPRAAWQIDSYGHTKEHASLLAQMGFDGLFIGRVDHSEKDAMIDDDRMEFMWRGSDVLGKMSDMMTHTLYNVYSAPEGFCFDFLCTDEPVVDDLDSGAFNAEKRINEFVRQIEGQAKYYDHDNILVTMGGDFTYQSAANWFMNMDNIISYVNSHQANVSDVNIFYSSPSCYLKAVYLYGRRDKLVHSEKGDHVPYGSSNETYWTGFYTSRPGLKYLAKRAHVFLQVVKQLSVLSSTQDFYELHYLRHAVGLVLHHDGITGTSLQHVANDYVKIVSEAVDACAKKISQFLSALTPTWGGRKRSKNNLQFTICYHMNLSQCSFTETEENMLVLVYNPLSFKTYHHIRLPATALHYSIKDYNDEEVEYQLLPLPAAIINLPGRNSTALQELCFEAENIPPLGFSAYFITLFRDQLAEGTFGKKNQQNSEHEQEIAPFISNEYLKVSVDKSTGLLESIQHQDGVKIMVNQNFYYYTQGHQNFNSGAYSFRPETERPRAISITSGKLVMDMASAASTLHLLNYCQSEEIVADKVLFHTTKGLLVKEIRQKYNEWVTQIIRLYRGEEFVELEWVIGPVPIGVHKKPIPACYYPVTSRICIQSENTSVEMCVLTDRTQGGTSYNAGEIELMIHRRLLTDDGFGLDEPLNEEAFGTGVLVRGKHRIYFGNFKQEDEQSFSERASQMARKWTMEPWLFFTPGEKISRRKWRNVRNKRYSGLQLNGLPRHIHILTLEPWKGGSVLLRLENLLEKSRVKKESSDHTSKSYITVDIRKIFVHHKVKMVRETTLAANQWLEEARQMDWSSRYIYPGSTDGILPEEHSDYTDDTPIEDNQSDFYSEDLVKRGPERRSNKKNRSKINQYNYNYSRRTPRSINLQNNYNKTNNVQTIRTHNHNETVTNEEKLFNNDKEFTNNVTGYKRFKDHASINERTTKPPKGEFSTIKTKETTELNRGKAKQEHLVFNKLTLKLNLNKSYDYDSYAEDFDDGITKSIYEMYYKNEPRRRIFKPFIRSSDEFLNDDIHNGNKKVKLNEEIDSFDSEIRQKNRRRTKGRSRFKLRIKTEDNEKNAREEDQEDREIEKPDRKSRIYKHVVDREESAEACDEDEDDYGESKSDKHTLKKRSPKYKQIHDSSELPDQNEDFVFSLRPTQIRTFVVWFEDK